MGENWIKPEFWDGQDLKGTYTETLKIDGVHAIWTGTEWTSRAGKPLYNLPGLSFHGERFAPASGARFEVFTGTLKGSVQAVRTQREGTPQVKLEHLYQLSPHLDERLHSIFRDDELVNPTALQIQRRLKVATDAGYEGLVLRGESKWLKVKPFETFDLQVIDIEEGKGGGKHVGRMGALITSKGKVGTGFTDGERILWWARRHKIKGTVGKHAKYLIEVECMGLTPGGKMRHSRYLRDRTWDKEHGK